jgi:opacity protein-like surface antigen
MKIRHLLVAVGISLTMCPVVSFAATSAREAGWEFGADVLYEFSQDVKFDGGSNLDLDDDIGFSISFGYRFNSRWELQGILDWNEVDYGGRLQSADLPGLAADITGHVEMFTPRVNGVFNFMDRSITPFVIGGIGWSFIDTNIPTGQVQVGCWWDPWWGQICTPYQPTKSSDAFTYQLGAGVRWDVSDALSLKFVYEKMWLDLSEATSAPGLDQVKLGIALRY